MLREERAVVLIHSIDIMNIQYGDFFPTISTDYITRLHL